MIVYHSAQKQQHSPSRSVISHNWRKNCCTVNSESILVYIEHVSALQVDEKGKKNKQTKKTACNFFSVKTIFKWQHEKGICVRRWAVVQNLPSPQPHTAFDLVCYFLKLPSALFPEQRTLTMAERPQLSFRSRFGNWPASRFVITTSASQSGKFGCYNYRVISNTNCTLGRALENVGELFLLCQCQLLFMRFKCAKNKKVSK